MLRLIKSSKGLQSLLTALLLSLPAMANLSGIFLIMQFLFAVLGPPAPAGPKAAATSNQGC